MFDFFPLLGISLAYVFAGFIVGFVMSLTGACKDSLTTLLLMFSLWIKTLLAIGADVLFAAFTKLGGTISLARNRLIDWSAAGQMALGSVPVCLIALYILEQLGSADPATPAIMTTTLGVALLLTGYARFYKTVWRITVSTYVAFEHSGQATNCWQAHFPSSGRAWCS